MRILRADFEAGQHLLSAYWNFLQAGGLVLPAHGGAGAAHDGAPAPLEEGAQVLVEVRIRSIKMTYRLGARVQRVHPDGRLFVTFLREQGQEVMVNAAWADTYAVPERRHRRYDVPAGLAEIQYAVDGHERTGVLANLSQGGCQLETDERIAVGTPVFLVGIGLATVRWAKRAPSRAMGLQFLTPLDAADANLKRLVTS